MKQKFRMLTFVVCQRHGATYLGIVKGTYSQIYGGKDIKSYSLWLIKNGRVFNQMSWFAEKHLKKVKGQNRLHAEKMVEEYNLSS